MNPVGGRQARGAVTVPSRFVRAVVFAAVAVALGAVGHAAASGELPAVEQCALLGFAVALASLSALKRERRLVEILLGLGVLQVGLHQGFAWLHDAAGGDALAAAHAQHGVAPGTSTWNWPMVAAHAVAVLGCAWWLRRGEAACWRRTRAAAAALAAFVKSLPNRPRPRLAPSDALASAACWSVPVSSCRPLVAGTPRRGPPRAFTPAAI